MRRLLQGLMLLVALELLGSAGLIIDRMRQAPPLLPPRAAMDADSWTDLQELATRARIGFGQSWLDLAEALAGKGFYSHAEVAYRRAFAIDPQENAALEGIAFCEDRTGRIAASNKTYRQLLPRTKGEAHQKMLYALGRNALRMEKPEEAEDLFRQNVEFLPARYMLCKLLVDSGRGHEAQPMVEAFLGTLPRALLFQRLKYQVSLQRNQPEQARIAAEAAERALLLIPVNFHTDFITERNERYGFRHLFTEYQKYAEFLTPAQQQATLLDLQNHLQGELSTSAIVVTRLLAEAAVKQRDAAGLEKALQQLGDWGISDATTLQRRGDAQALAGDMKQAAADWELAVSMTPTVELHRKLADYYQSVKKKTHAQTHRSQAALLEGQHLYRDDQLDRALELMTQSISENPDNAWSWFYLAEIQRTRQNLSEADQAYQKYVALAPTCLRPR